MVGDNGTVIFSVPGVLQSIETTYPVQAGIDWIDAGGGADVVIGGAGADILFAGDDIVQDIIIGDEARLDFDVSGRLISAMSIAPTFGGNDVIETGGGDNIVIAGSGDDEINKPRVGRTLTAPSGNDIVVGDNGTVIFSVPGVIQSLVTTSPATAGNDWIDAGAGADIVVGGAGSDYLFAGGDVDADIVIGDEVELSFDALGHIVTARSIVPALGGDDIIEMGGGANIVIGGTGNDEINKPRDGRILTASTGYDIVLGDNGNIVFSAPGLLASVETSYPVNAGNDWIDTGAGSDIIFGGAGNDVLFGGDDLDPDLIFGDEGLSTFDSAGKLVTSESASFQYGGDDIIETGGGDNIVIAGSGADEINKPRSGRTINLGDGKDIILGDSGMIVYSAPGVLLRVETTGATYAGADWIDAGSGGDIVIGGSGADRLYAGADEASDIVIGDEGRLDFDPNGYLVHAFSILSAVGGSDVIEAIGGDNIVIGGAAGDTITTGNGVDIILGDNGQFDFAANVARTLLLARSTDPLDGGNDTITAAGGSDLVFGGTGADTIYGDAGNDTLLGDAGLYDITLPVNQRTMSIFFRNLDGGGNDTIYGGEGDDFIFGQQGADQIFGGAGEDDILGGNNVIGGADGSDTIDSGAGADVVLGDNGVILRTVTVENWKTMDWARDLAPSLAVTRAVTVYDQIDYIGGNDTIRGGAGDDRLFGQRGNDTIDGCEGLDEIIGGLGSDTLSGGSGNDMILGDEGRIVRSFTGVLPRLNSDGSWHRDVILVDRI